MGGNESGRDSPTKILVCSRAKSVGAASNLGENIGTEVVAKKTLPGKKRCPSVCRALGHPQNPSYLPKPFAIAFTMEAWASSSLKAQKKAPPSPPGTRVFT
jgi:hypothetical protein